MTITVDQRVRCTATPEARDAHIAILSVFLPEDHDDIVAVKGRPVVGDTGTVEGMTDDGWYDVKWDREIGPVTGKRASEFHWFVSVDEIEPIEGEVAAAA